MKTGLAGGIPESSGQAPAHHPIPPPLHPQTPLAQNAPLPSPQSLAGPQPQHHQQQQHQQQQQQQLPQQQLPPPATPTQSSPPPKTTPTKPTQLKALPTVRDHTTDQLVPTNDEYVPRETDEAGEKKVDANGVLLGGRTYRIRTFQVPNRGQKLFMLATECARVLGYRDSYLLFNKNRSLYKIIASQVEKDDLVSQEILPFSYRSRQIAIVTARSMFRQFGSRVVENGRRVRDDYWEGKARKQGFTEADMAGEKRPGAAKAREAAAEASQNAMLMGGPHGEIVYSNTPAAFGGGPQPMIPPDYPDTRRPDYANILKTGPRQEITGPPYSDRSQPTAMSELNAQAHHAAEYNRGVNQQRDMRNDYLQNMWRRPHEQPATANLNPPVGGSDQSIPSSRPAQSSHPAVAGMQHSGMMPGQNIHNLQSIVTGPPYSASMQAQNTLSQSSGIRGSSSAVPQTPSSYSNYQSPNQMWPPTPQTPQQYGYTHTAQGAQSAPHQSQPAASPIRHSGVGAPMQAYSGMPAMAPGYSAPAPYDHQTPRQYLHQPGNSTPAVSQAWSSQQTPGQWWTQQPQ